MRVLAGVSPGLALPPFALGSVPMATAMKRAVERSSEAVGALSMDERAIRCPSAARRLVRALRPSVLDALASRLEWRSARVERSSLLVWADNAGALHSARCEPYTLPHRDDPARPLTIRISVNHLHVPHLEDVARRAGMPDTGASPCELSTALRRKRPRFELSCLPHEAVDYAAWLGKFLRAHQQDDPYLIPSPPVPTYFWNGLTLDCNYAWSQLGWELIERYHYPHAAVPEPPPLAALIKVERNA